MELEEDVPRIVLVDVFCTVALSTDVVSPETRVTNGRFHALFTEAGQRARNINVSNRFFLFSFFPFLSNVHDERPPSSLFHPPLHTPLSLAVASGLQPYVIFRSILARDASIFTEEHTVV